MCHMLNQVQYLAKTWGKTPMTNLNGITVNCYHEALTWLLYITKYPDRCGINVCIFFILFHSKRTALIILLCWFFAMVSQRMTAKKFITMGFLFKHLITFCCNIRAQIREYRTWSMTEGKSQVFLYLFF